MGYFVAFVVEGQEEPVDADDIATNSGWAAFQDWAAELSEADYPELWYLGEYGEVYDAEGDEQGRALDRLESDLELAIHARPDNPTEDVLHVARRLLAIVQGRPDGAAAMVVTDGTNEEDDE